MELERKWNDEDLQEFIEGQPVNQVEKWAGRCREARANETNPERPALSLAERRWALARLAEQAN